MIEEPSRTARIAAYITFVALFVLLMYGLFWLGMFLHSTMPSGC